MRLFVGLDLPWSLRERLAMLSGGLPGARWVPSENYHLTLRFIGEVTPPRAEDVDDALMALRLRAVTLSLAGIGTFDKAGRPHSLWVGAERAPALEQLQSKIETALQRAGLEPERRRFVPHVTLARLDPGRLDGARLAGWVQAHNLFRAAPVPIAHVTLFSSRRGKEQSVYTAEAEYDLSDAPLTKAG